MAKPVVFVIGANGNIGASTVMALSTKYADKVEIRAGVRNPEKADKIKSLEGVTVVQATMGDEKLEQVLSGVDTLFINTPGAPNRVSLATSTAELAKKAGVKHVVFVSIPSAKVTDTIFGRQFAEIEGAISKLGIPYTVISIPSFFENYWQYKSTIANQGKIFCPVDPEKSFAAIAVEDAGKATAAILVNPSSYANKTFTLVSDCQT